MTKGKRILVVDDEPPVRAVLRDRLVAEGFEVVEAESGEEAVAVFRERRPDLVLMDVRMETDDEGFRATRRIKELAGERFVPVVLCTVYDDVRSKQRGLECGADDFVTKPSDPTEVVVRVRSMLRIQELAERNDRLVNRNRRLAERGKDLARENEDLRSRLVLPDPSTPFVGDTPAIRTVLRLVEKAAAIDETVLITGETGVGKELVARMIHHNSRRRDRPLVVVDVPAISEGLFEAELFGHRKGGFTGAHADRPGVLALAAGSTVLLDEIGELRPSMQSKLLRFLQDHAVRPVGADRAEPVDVRVLAATNRNLEEMVRRGRFRKDLYHRLGVVHIHVPPLRERKGDIPALAHAFLLDFNRRNARRVGGLSPEVLGALQDLEFGGNVRELSNLVRFAAMLAADGEPVAPEHLAAACAHYGIDACPGVPADLASARDEALRRTIARHLERFGGDRTRTAAALGVTRQGLWKMMKRLGMNG